MNDLKLPLAAITDEFSPTDLGAALEPMASIGMTGAELRVVFGKNIMDLTDEEVLRAKEMCAAKGVSIIGIASPILKCVLPGGPAVDTRFQQDIFNSKHTFDDQPRLLDRAFRLCELTGAKFIRVFSYWRTVEPEACFEAVVTALSERAASSAACVPLSAAMIALRITSTAACLEQITGNVGRSQRGSSMYTTAPSSAPWNASFAA
jgi:sugar phosphate isomerase/epimerase